MGAGHSHATASGHRGALAVVVALTGSVVVAQAVGAVLTGSLALLTDTVHALTDVAGLSVALVAATLMTRPASGRRTWGFRRIEVIAAFGQAALLLAVGGYAAVEGIRRLIDPPEVPGPELLFFGVIGLAANVAGMLILSSRRDHNMNMRAAFLEVANDALGSLGVIVSAIVIATTGYQRADAIAALFIAALIVPRALLLLRDTARVLMEFAPPDLDLEELRVHLGGVEHVESVHDLHASTVATGLPVLTAHVVVGEECFHDGHSVEILESLRECVAAHFSVAHATFQLEPSGACRVEGQDDGCAA